MRITEGGGCGAYKGGGAYRQRHTVFYFKIALFYYCFYSHQGYRVNDCVSPAHDGSFEPEGIIHHLSGYGSSSSIYFSVFCFYSTTFCWSLNVPIPQHGVGVTRG